MQAKENPHTTKNRNR